MAITILQNPATASLAQSPMIFSVSESVNTTKSNFQYVAGLYYWTGALADSGSTNYTLVKYPNSAGVGLFDVSRIINSTLTDLAIANPSNVVFYKCDFYSQWLTGSAGTTLETGSHQISDVFKALDGYAIFQEPINQQIVSKSLFWPIMTDGPQSQSVFTENIGTFGVYTAAVGGTQPNSLFFSSSVGTGSIALSSSTATNGQIQQVGVFPSSSGFPLTQVGLTDYYIVAKNGSTELGNKIYFTLECQQKYPNVRVKWKNRYGQFDYLNFYGVSQNSFDTNRSTYQPQIGTWESSTLSYNSYDSQIKTYVVNSTQQLTVNSQWLSQDYNELIKQLLSADEAYWVYDEPNGDVRPISIKTDSVTFKTGVVDKLIQYTFQFDWAQNYKLII
jgi:hypothetical protein